MNQPTSALQGYEQVHTGIVGLLETARRAAARSVNALMTATYWEIGRRIVECEQGGQERAAYGAALIDRLAADLTRRFGRGFSRLNSGRCEPFTWLGPSTEFSRQCLENCRGRGLSRRSPGNRLKGTSQHRRLASPSTSQP